VRPRADPDRSGLLLGVYGMPRSPFVPALDFNSLLGPMFYCWTVQMLLPSIVRRPSSLLRPPRLRGPPARCAPAQRHG